MFVACVHVCGGEQPVYVQRAEEGIGCRPPSPQPDSSEARLLPGPGACVFWLGHQPGSLSAGTTPC